MTEKLTPGMQLAEELAQAILTDDTKATQVAAVNIVGMYLDTQLRQAFALEAISEMISTNMHRADYAFHVKQTS